MFRVGYNKSFYTECHSPIFLMKNVITIRDFSRHDLDMIIAEALQYKGNRRASRPLEDKMVASLFYQHSTRTRESSEIAAIRLGAFVRGMAGPEASSVAKGECLERTAQQYIGYGADLLVLRHPVAGSARLMADVFKIPVINGGDGYNSHPSQTALDLVTITEAVGRLDGIKVALVGDLKYGRTVHSFLHACERYDIEPWLVAPEIVQMPAWRIRDYEEATGKKVVRTDDLNEALRACHVVYMTRVQKEWFADTREGREEYERVTKSLQLTADRVRGLPIVILHPQPIYMHQPEITPDVQKLPNAWFDQESANGVPTRMALMARSIGEGYEGIPRPAPENSLWQDLPIPGGDKRGENLLYRLDNGTLIDHLEQGAGMRVLTLLGLHKERDVEVVPPFNIRSTRYGRKDVIAIHGKELSEDDLQRIGLVTTRATINIIQDGRVVRKGRVNVPGELHGILTCVNDNCISNKTGENAPSYFTLERRDPLLLRCHYCEQSYTRPEIRLKE